MNQANFSITLCVDQAPEAVFSAINDVRSWWTGSIEGPSDVLGGEFSYRYKQLHFSKQRVTELVPGRKVEWTVIDSALQFAQRKDEWTGTKLVFDIAQQGNQTEIRFTHVGLVPEFDCYGACSRGWTQVIHELETFITSRGNAAPKARETIGRGSESSAKAVANVTQGTLLATVEIAAPPERVFRALTSEEIVSWWGSADTYRTTRWTGDVRVGGAWRADYQPREGKPFSVQSELLALDPPRSLVQTWRYVNADWDPIDSVTTISWCFEPTETGTRVVVRHEGFGDAHASCENHAAGWERVLGWLCEHFR